MFKSWWGIEKKELNEVELSAALAAKMGDIQSIEITKDGAKEIYASMGNIDGLLDHLRDTMVNDIKRYFAAQTDAERQIIRGAFSRTSYFRSLILTETGKDGTI